MNGSRLREHRMPRVSPESWMLLVGLIAGMLALGSAFTKDAEGAERGDRGVLPENTSLCQVNYIGPITVSMVEDNHRIATIILEKGIESLSYRDYTRGAELYFGQCGSVAEPYHVIIFRVDGDYALMVFDARHNFERETFIIRLADFVPDGTVQL